MYETLSHPLPSLSLALPLKYRPLTLQTCLTLNVDLNPDETGLASVAASVIRCLAAAAGVAVLEPMLDAVGAGWTFTVYALIAVLAIPLLLTLRTFGPRWRNCDWEDRVAAEVAHREEAAAPPQEEKK